MVFLGRLFGLIVFLVFVSAIFLNLADQVDVRNFNFEKDVELSSEDSKTNNEVESFYSQTAPVSFKSEQNNRSLNLVLPETISELEKIIYLEDGVYVSLNNEYLKNPFIGHSGQVIVNLIGYNETHLISDGSEIGASNFIYVKEDFWTALKVSNGSVWINRN